MREELQRDPEPAVVPAVTRSVVEGFTEAQRKTLAEVYIKIAQALPVEGRDYVLHISFADQSNRAHVSITGLTPIGRAFAEHLNTFLRGH